MKENAEAFWIIKLRKIIYALRITNYALRITNYAFFSYC